MKLEDCLRKVRIEPFGKMGEKHEGSEFEWGYTVYAGAFQLYATKARRIHDHYELILEYSLNHEGAMFPEKRLKIIDLNKLEEADQILRKTAEDRASIVTQRIGLEYLGFVSN